MWPIEGCSLSLGQSGALFLFLCRSSGIAARQHSGLQAGASVWEIAAQTKQVLDFPEALHSQWASCPSPKPANVPAVVVGTAVQSLAGINKIVCSGSITPTSCFAAVDREAKRCLGHKRRKAMRKMLPPPHHQGTLG